MLCLLVCGWLTACGTLGSYARYSNRGSELFRAGDYEGAAEQFREAANRSASDVSSHYLLGVSLIKLGRYGQAQRPLEQAMAVASRTSTFNGRIRDRLAEVYYQQGRIEKLHAFLEEAVAEGGQRPRDYLRQANFLQRTGDLDGARLALRKAAYFSDPGDPQPHLELADFYELIGDTEAARRSLRHAYFLQPDHPEVGPRLEGYGVVLGPAAGLRPPAPATLEVLEPPAETTR